MFCPLSQFALAHRIYLSKIRTKHEMCLEVDKMVDRVYDQELADLQQFYTFDQSKLNQQRVDKSPSRFPLLCHIKSANFISQNVTDLVNVPLYGNQQTSITQSIVPIVNQSFNLEPFNCKAIQTEELDPTHSITPHSLLIGQSFTTSQNPPPPVSIINVESNPMPAQHEFVATEIESMVTVQAQYPSSSSSIVNEQSNYEMTKQVATRQPTDEAQPNEDRPAEEGDRMGSEQSEAIDILATIQYYDHDHYNSDNDMVLQPEERNANNANGEESNATELTTNPIQPNLHQPNLHWQCAHCSKSFAFRSQYQRHLRVHTGERPFQCDQCGKRFPMKGSLTAHKLIHQNIKPFRCHECDKRFTQKFNLKVHLRAHYGVRLFACLHCDKLFTHSSAVTRHENDMHLHVKLYRCTKCGYTATQRSNVIIHVQTVHFGLPDTKKKQRALNIIDHRDPREFVELVRD